MQVRNALLVELEARPGKEGDVVRFLQSGLSLVENEPATLSWFAVRFSESKFGIFDAFPDESGRQAHLAGRVASALIDRAPDLFAHDPKITRLEVIAAKLPDGDGIGIHTDDSGLGFPGKNPKDEAL